jgi:hypothetical protein
MLRGGDRRVSDPSIEIVPRSEFLRAGSRPVHRGVRQRHLRICQIGHMLFGKKTRKTPKRVIAIAKRRLDLYLETAEEGD